MLSHVEKVGRRSTATFSLVSLPQTSQDRGGILPIDTADGLEPGVALRRITYPKGVQVYC
jgi:hypothetical protein